MKLIRLILRRPTSVILMILAVVVFGSASLTGMPLEYMPDMEMPMELVMVTWPGADADSVDRLLTQPLEDECESLSDLDSINSYSSENYTMLQLTYQYGTDMDDAYSDLKSAIDNLMPSLPDECGDPIIMEISADALGTMMISATAPQGIDVADYLDSDVVPALENIGGVAQVELAGDVGGRDDDGEGLLLGIALGVEVVAVEPHVVDLLFDLLGVIDFRQFFHSCLLSDCPGRAKTPRSVLLQGA